MVSPADGTITNSAPLKVSATSVPSLPHCSTQDGCTQLVKGLSYSLQFFLGSLDNVAEAIRDNDDLHYDNGFLPRLQLNTHYSQLLLHGGTRLYETTVYLSPGDYHR